jgi:peptidoglycan/xylan/chitin deacetylase (PgdA/CDA1 family)
MSRLLLRLPRFALCFLAAALTLSAADAPARKRVALVMDDGPVAEHTEVYLALFAREHIHITFSHIGRNVVVHPELAKAVVAAGHEVANHSYTHVHMNTLSDAEIASEVTKTQAAEVKATGKAPVWFWSPYLDHDAHVDAVVRRAAGIEHFPFTKYHFIGSLDWEATTTAEKFRELATTGIVDGTVILIHEWPEVTLSNLSWVITELKRQGVEFVTFSELAK